MVAAKPSLALVVRRSLRPLARAFTLAVPFPPAGAVAAGLSLAVALVAPAARADEGPSRWRFGGTGETVFEHTRASLRDPHFGMRVYLSDKVPGTLSPIDNPSSPDADARAAADTRPHIFWDVAFGERAPVLGWYDVHPTRSVRHARGFQLNIDAAAFLLLDFRAQSDAVINTDYRIGLSADLRPWSDGWDRLSFSVGAFHQSTHLGDEYVLSARTIQDTGPPAVNPYLPFRGNPSYLAFPLTVSFDLVPDTLPQYSARLYAGGAVYAESGIPEETHPDLRGGIELRYGYPERADGGYAPPADSGGVGQFLERAKHFGLGASSSAAEKPIAPVAGPRGRTLRRGASAYMIAYELLAQRRFGLAPNAPPGTPIFASQDGYWLTHHVMAIWLWNLDTERSTSNALAFALEYIDGRNQHGQLIVYDSMRTVAASISYYW